MNIFQLSLFQAILSLLPVVIHTVPWHNSPGRPAMPVTSFPQCEHYETNPGNTKSGIPMDYNPVLRSYGRFGLPGAKLRLNWNAFRYGSEMIARMFGEQLRTIRIPPLAQCLPEVNGCAYLTNMQITNHRCPRQVIIHPVSNNEILIGVQNFDLSAMGQLSGQMAVLLPLPLCGSLCIDARQVSITLKLAIERNPYNGALYVRMSGCSVTVGYLNMYIINGGLIGELINSNFRNKLITKAQEALPDKFCSMLPSLLNEHVNSRLMAAPQRTPLVQILPYAYALIQKPKRLPEYCYSDICKHYHSFNISAVNKKQKSKATLTAGVPNIPQQQPLFPTTIPFPTLFQPNHRTKPEIVTPVPVHKRNQKFQQPLFPTAPPFPNLQQPNHGTKPEIVTPVPVNKRNQKFPISNGQHAHMPKKMKQIPNTFGQWQKRTKRNIGSIAPTNWQQCENCDYDRSEVISQYFDTILDRIRRCAADLSLSTYYMGSSATNADLTLDYAVEFSPNLRSASMPFGPPAIQYPTARSDKMFDLLISDHVLNTLLYEMHRRDVFAFRIGPEIPVVGDLLNFTCAAEDVDFDLSLELEDKKEGTENQTLPNHTATFRQRRTKRHATMDTLSNFGICLGDLTPAIRDKYRGKRAYIVIKTHRAPSVQFHPGQILIEFIIDGFIFLHGTVIQVGEIRAYTSLSLDVHITDNRVYAMAQFENITFVDVGKTFGLPEEAFINLSDLARGIIARAINKKLANGIPLSMPQLGLPVQFYNMNLQMAEHALLISTDGGLSSANNSPHQRYRNCVY